MIVDVERDANGWPVRLYLDPKRNQSMSKSDPVLLLGYSGSRVLAEARIGADGKWRVGIIGSGAPRTASYTLREAREELTRAGASQIQAFDQEALDKWDARERQWEAKRD